MVCLGIPIGSSAFINRTLHEFQQKIVEDTAQLFCTLPNSQTCGQIYHKCILPRTLFCTTADVLANFYEKFYADPFH